MDVVCQTRDDYTGDERCTKILVEVSGGKRVNKYTGRKRYKRWLLTNERYLHCSAVDVAADASMNMVPMASGS